MINISYSKVIQTISLPLAVLVIITSSLGIFTPDFYSRETLNWQSQSAGQDIIDLFLVTPSLIVISILARRNNKTLFLVWGGVILYLAYTFAIFCFDVHFNKLFVPYCMILGISIYSFAFLLYAKCGRTVPDEVKNMPAMRFAAFYFLVISVAFCFLWLREILPAAFSNTVPESLTATGLPTNPVHVIDLSVVLPGIFITGILILKRKHLGFILAPVILTFIILMDVTIAFLTVMMRAGSEPGEYLPLAVIMCLLAAFSLRILVSLYREKIKTGHAEKRAGDGT